MKNLTINENETICGGMVRKYNIIDIPKNCDPTQKMIIAEYNFNVMFGKANKVYDHLYKKPRNCPTKSLLVFAGIAITAAVSVGGYLLHKAHTTDKQDLSK